MTDSFPVLYILMRNDLASMNAGKGMAQASHASNAFVYEMKAATEDGGDSFEPDLTPMIDLFEKWQNETPQGFGTVLVLGVNQVQLQTAVMVANGLGFAANTIHDPTYPLVDGDFVHFLPLDTCAYIFGDKNDTLLGAVVGCFPLHP